MITRRCRIVDEFLKGLRQYIGAFQAIMGWEGSSMLLVENGAFLAVLDFLSGYTTKMLPIGNILGQRSVGISPPSLHDLLVSVDWGGQRYREPQQSASLHQLLTIHRRLLGCAALITNLPHNAFATRSKRAAVQ